MRDTDADGPLPDRQWLWDLANQLQKSLHVPDVVRVFSEHTATVIPHDSAEFQEASGTDPVRVGTVAEHRCSFKVRLPDEYLGTISFSRSTPFSPAETTTLENIVLNVVYPLRNSLLFERVLKVAAQDPLTGLGNRASLNATLETEIARASRHEEPLSVIMVDVDHFKGINDAHGHVAGDRVLKALSRCIAECIRDSDLAFRFGGEEFVILLSKTGLDGALQLAERVRDRVERMPVVLEGAEIRVSVSIGVAVHESTESGTALLEKADSAMYRSKTEGRNRVSHVPAGRRPGPTVGSRRPAARS